MKLLLSPHNDDETLWCAYTIMREKPLVVVVFDGYVQGNRGAVVNARQRRSESSAALLTLGVGLPRFLGLRDDDPKVTVDDIVFRLRSVVDMDQKFDAVYMPMFDADGHEQHNLVWRAGDMLDAANHVMYSTYTRSGGRQRTANEVLPDDGSMVARKHRALACYASQMDMDPRLGTWTWFAGDLREYTA